MLDWYRKHLLPLSAFALRRATAASRIEWLETLDVTLAEIEREYVEHVLPSHDGTEGIAAFLEKRAPAWTDA